ncbi:hypothetical protein [Mesorhizobium ventifaucium]|uniref:Acyl carrier protein n=1 Tax=Mesorhizobium ventifaucium TaxID=666020 RepID=A0ABM9E778_9HYPH|nr:hypothetical protein [Mesorhizobium ventifaucium]CAH2404979.1 conserved hypothetical protein [Mesorhizobium ventifaucium]
MTEELLFTTQDLDSLVALINDFASELDLQYEDSDLHALEPSITNLGNVARVLEQNEYPLPDAYVHILERYRQATASLA